VLRHDSHQGRGAAIEPRKTSNSARKFLRFTNRARCVQVQIPIPTHTCAPSRRAARAPNLRRSPRRDGDAAGIRYQRGGWAIRSSGQGTARRKRKEKDGEGGEADLLLELGELAALRLEGEDGPVDVRDLGLLHEDVPHLRGRGVAPAARWRDGGGVGDAEEGKGGLGGDETVTASQQLSRAVPAGQRMRVGSCLGGTNHRCWTRRTFSFFF
jgi:hypothetical protein